MRSAWMGAVTRRLLGGLVALGAVQAALAGQSSSQSQAPESFKGKIEVSAKDSIPDWPRPTGAPRGAPNIVLILLDDIGFADTSTFGGVAQTPELDALAARGLRYNNFNTTATCSPTRAA